MRSPPGIRQRGLRPRISNANTVAKAATKAIHDAEAALANPAAGFVRHAGNSAQVALHDRVAGPELGHQRVRRTQVAAEGPAAAAEVRVRHAGVEDGGRVGVAQHGDRHRAADVGRVHAGVNGVLGGDDAADGYGADVCPGWTGVGHHGAGDDGRHPHQLGHVPLDAGDVGGLFCILGADVEVVGVLATLTQGNGR